MGIFGLCIDENTMNSENKRMENKIREVAKLRFELGEKILKLQKCEKENGLLNGKVNELSIEVSKLLDENESLKRKIRKLKRKIKNDLDCSN